MKAIAKAQQTNPALTDSKQYELFIIDKPWAAFVEAEKFVRSVKEKFWQDCLSIMAKEHFPLFLSFIEAVRAIEKHAPVGRKADPAGNLFLLAVSERLKAQGIHKQNISAGKMLATLRPRVNSSAIAQRVSELKRSYKSWKSLLKKLDKGFERCRKTPTNMREEKKIVLPNYSELAKAQLKMLLDTVKGRGAVN